MHSSILAWEILWKEGPSGPQSMGSQKLNTIEHAPTPHHHTLTKETNCNFSYYLFRSYFQALVSLINKLEVSTFSAVWNSIE